MNGFKPGGEACALHDYEELLAVLDKLGAISTSQKDDLCNENLYAVGQCSVECSRACMASAFFPYLADSAPHTRHLNVPFLADDREIEEELEI